MKIYLILMLCYLFLFVCLFIEFCAFFFQIEQLGGSFTTKIKN